MAAPLPVPQQPPAHVRAVVHRILARPEYHRHEDALARARRSVGETIGHLIDSVFSGGRGEAVSIVIVIAAVAVVAFFLVRLVRGMTRDPTMKQRAFTRRRTAAEWNADADSHEAARRWRLAVRCRYRAAVAALAERGVVEEVPGRTAGEYRAAVADALPSAAARFGEVTETFERAWYGHRPADESDAARVRELAGLVAGRPR